MMSFKKNLACKKLLADFKNELKAAMKGYNQKFSLPYNPPPSYRVGDLSALEIFIDTFQFNDKLLAQGLIQGVVNIIAKFKTGLIIFEACLWPSGKSTLKDALLEVINNPKYSNEAFLKAWNQDLERRLTFLNYKYKRLKESIPSLEKMDGKDLHKLQKNFKQAKTNITLLVEEKEELESTKEGLSKACAKSQKRSSWFFDTNQQLGQENQALQQRLDRANESPNNARDDAQSGSADAATTSQSRYHGSLGRYPRFSR